MPYAAVKSDFKTNPQFDAMFQSTADDEADAAGKIEAKEDAIDQEIGKLQSRGDTIWQRGLTLADSLAADRDALTDLGKRMPEYKEPPPPPEAKQTDPLQSFGSLASMVAIIGSALTKRPIMNAFDNAAGVLEAYKQNDSARAKAEFDRWKANVENYNTIFKFQQDQYKTAIDRIGANSRAAADEMRVLASAFEDNTMRVLAEQRDYKGLVDLYNKRDSVNGKFSANNQRLLDYQHRLGLYTQALADAEKAGALTPEQKIALYNKYMVKPSGSSGLGGAMTENQESDNARQWFKILGYDEFATPEENEENFKEFLEDKWPEIRQKLPGSSVPSSAAPPAVTPPAQPAAKPAATKQGSGRSADSLSTEERAAILKFWPSVQAGQDVELGDGSRWRVVNGQIVAVTTGPSGGNLTLAQAEALGSKIKPKGGQTPANLRVEEQRAAESSYEFKKELEESKPLSKGEMEAFDASLAFPDYEADLRTQNTTPVISRQGETFIKNPLPPEIPSRPGSVRPIAELRKAPISSFSKEELRAYGKAGPKLVDSIFVKLAEQGADAAAYKKLYHKLRVNDIEGSRLALQNQNQINDKLLVGTLEETLRDAMRRSVDLESEFAKIKEERESRALAEDDVRRIIPSPGDKIRLSDADMQSLRNEINREIEEILKIKRRAVAYAAKRQ